MVLKNQCQDAVILRLCDPMATLNTLKLTTTKMTNVAKRVISRYKVGQLTNPKIVEWLAFLFDLGM